MTMTAVFGKRTRSKEDYFTASQAQLVWARFVRKRSAMVAAGFLIAFILCGLFAPFLSPYDPTVAGRDKDYTNGAPQVPLFCDANGCDIRPFIHLVERHRGVDTNFRWVTRQTDKRDYLTFLPQAWSYRIGAFAFDLPGEAFDIRIPGLEVKTHLFGVEKGYIHLFGTDAAGKDIFSRTLHAIGVSLSVGTLGLVITFVLALGIGGVAGYFGGWIDTVVQTVTDAVRTVPTIPLFMSLAAFIPDEWSAETRFFFISMILDWSAGRPWRGAFAPIFWPSAPPTTSLPPSWVAPRPPTLSAGICFRASPAILSSIRSSIFPT